MGRKSKPRRYSDDERATALAALAANGGNVSKTARELGIPEPTVRAWSRGDRHPEAVQMCEGKKGPLADAIQAVVEGIVASLPGKVPAAPLQAAATAAAILIDKMQLLRGEPDKITENRDDQRLSAFRARYAAHAPGDPGADARDPLRPPPADGAATPVPGT